MTAVGGTTLSTDAHGNWLAEQGWYDVPLTQGSGGGSSVLFSRPPWQVGHEHAGPHDRRLVPDVAAVADPFTGVKFVFRQQVLVGGGTSQSAPIWAGLATVMNQFLVSPRAESAGRSQSAALRRRPGCRAARVPGHRAGRQRRHPGAPRLRHDHRAGQPQHRQPHQGPADPEVDRPMSSHVTDPESGNFSGYAVPTGRYRAAPDAWPRLHRDPGRLGRLAGVGDDGPERAGHPDQPEPHPLRVPAGLRTAARPDCRWRPIPGSSRSTARSRCPIRRRKRPTP